MERNYGAIFYKWAGWLSIIAGFAVGNLRGQQWNSFNWELCLEWWIGGLVIGITWIGFSLILKQKQK